MINTYVHLIFFLSLGEPYLMFKKVFFSFVFIL